MAREMIFCAVVVALLAAFTLQLLRKWDVIEWLQVHGSPLISRAANCSFCLSWWCAWVFAIAFTITSGDTSWLVAPFLSTPLTRVLL